MARLLLIKHSLPELIHSQPAAMWRLSAEGRTRCEALAAAVAPYQPAQVFASVEPKAAETAHLLAAQLGLPWQAAPGLHEHERRTTPWLDAPEFAAQVARCFAQPSTLVLGEETADQAHSRFAAAVDGLVAAHPGRTLAVVAHGTVISLYVARANGLDPLPLWQQLALPSFVVLELPTRKPVQYHFTCDDQAGQGH